MRLSNKLKNYGEEWQVKLTECQYVGEIYLENDELVNLAQEYKPDRERLPKDNTHRSILVVFAVNCAYHYYDDQGFWIHFCQLLGVNNTTAVKDFYGILIEGKLRELNLLKVERSGPFRYVGAILEQCGVSKRHIPQLANLVSDIKNTLGWDAFSQMSQAEFSLRLDSVGCSKYLKSFLQDNEGWLFTMQAGYLTRLYEQGVMSLDDLQQLTGYQPDFWPEFLPVFKAEKNDQQRNVVIIKPKIQLIKDDLSFAITFPSPDYIKNVINPGFVDNWVYPLTKLSKIEMWSNVYSGELITEEKNRIGWQIEGWVPDGEPVLFDLNSGLLPHGAYLSPGEYILIAPDTFRITLSIKQAYGPVNYPFNDEYSAYLVQINHNDNMPGYNFNFSDVAVPRIEWIDPERYALSFNNTPIDVFQNELPVLKVSDFVAIEKNIIGIFYDIGKGTKRIRCQDDIEKFQVEVKKCAPVNGSIWMSVISRSRFTSFIPPTESISFCLLPEFKIEYDQRLYGFNEDAMIAIETSTDVKVNFHECMPLQGCKNCWQIKPLLDFAEGSVAFKDSIVSLKIPVRRARLLGPKGEIIRYFTEQDIKKQGIRILGIPDHEIGLNLLNSNNESITVRLESRGVAELPTDELYQIVSSSEKHLHELVVHVENKIIDTGAIYLNMKRIEEDVVSGCQLHFAAINARNIEKILLICSGIAKQPESKIQFNLLPKMHPDMEVWVHTMLACASVFDNTEIMIAGSPFCWQAEAIKSEASKVLALYQSDRSPESDLDTIAIPGVKRWREAILLMNYKNTESYRLELISNWANELRGKKASYRSEISKWDGGPILNMAWASYLEGNIERTIELLNNIQCCTQPILSDLKVILWLISYLRLARFYAARDLLNSASPSDELKPYYVTIGLILYYVGLVQNYPIHITGLKQAPSLPFSKVDLKLMETVDNVEQGVAVTGVDMFNKDWLVLYFIMHRTENNQEKTAIASEILKISDSIPPSPEKTEIIKKIKGQTRG